MSKIKNGGLDQYGAEPLEQLQFGTAGIEGVNWSFIDDFSVYSYCTVLSSVVAK